MAKALGVFVCCFASCLALACSFGIVRVPSSGAYRKKMPTGRPSRLLCLTLAFLLCFLCSSVALADEEVEQVLEPLPENYIDVMLTRTSGNQYVAIENDTAVLKSVGSSATSGGDYVGAWYSVFLDLVKDDYTVNQATSAIMHDLAWRYYNYPDKRDKIPLTVKPSFNNQAYKLQDCSSYGDWCIKNRFVNNTYGSLASQYCTLLELNHQGKYWSSISPGADILYKEWYEYYEGTSTSGGSSTITSLGSYNRSTGAVTFVSTNNPVRLKIANLQINNNTAYVTTQYPSYTDRIVGTLSVAYDDSRHPDMSMFIDFEYYTGNVWFYDSQALQPVYTVVDGIQRLTGLKNISDDSTVIYNYNFRFAENWFTIDGDTGYLNVTISGTQNATGGYNTHGVGSGSTYDISNMSFVAFENGGGSSGGGGSSEPVPSPGIPTTPTPTAPNVTNISAPTYTTNSYTTINQTDVDLQPVIDALAIHDENMQDAWDSYSILINDWLDVIKQTMEGWRDAQLGYMETLYKDFVYYLDQVNFVLWQILEQLQIDTYVPVPDVDTININYNNSVDRLSTKFPFSIPWDIKLVLVLLEQPRQAPEFDLPVLMSDYTVHVDLSPFEPMAEVSRFFSMLLFTAGLMMNTRKVVGF